MPAKQNDTIQEAVVTLHKLSADEKIRLQCWALEDYERRINRIYYEINKRDAIIAEKNTAIAATIAEKNAAIADKDAEIAALKSKRQTTLFALKIAAD